MRTATLAALVLSLGIPSIARAQCPAGEVEVKIIVDTDPYGFETYWQLVPGGNSCGTGMIAEGGNLYLDCDSGGTQAQTLGGYGNNTFITEGPWCLTEGASFDLWALDDWGDGQAAYSILVDDTVVAVFQKGGPEHVFSFTAQVSMRDMFTSELTTSLFAHEDHPVVVSGTLGTFGYDAVNSFDLVYAVDGGAPVIQQINGVTLNVGDLYEFVHAVPWTGGTAGGHALHVWAQNINGQADENPVNDQGSSVIQLTPAIPNIVDQYIWGAPTMEVIANSNEDLLVPRDLDFHPDPQRNELWVINKDVEGTGGSTVKLTAPGDPGMTYLWQRDQNAWHFMSLPTGIAFGDNGDFSTCPGVFDANHNGGTPFTGISLWSSDPAIYAQPIFGGLGSHLDMLHVTPNSQGIAHERWNRYWVVDGFNGDVVMHDFKGDHGPGNDDHGNAVIRRYDQDQITRDPNDHIVSHCAFDKQTGWLYVVDFGGQRVFRIDTKTGSVTGPGDYGPWETYVEYTMVTGYTQQEMVATGLVQPAGIDVVGDRMIVSDHSNGDIVLYDVTVVPAVELGRVHTLLPGIMGVSIGPDGRIWYVNANTNELVRVSPDANVGIAGTTVSDWSVAPNPADDRLWIRGGSITVGTPVLITDATGREVLRAKTMAAADAIDVSGLASGSYLLQVEGRARPFVVRR